MVWDKRLKWTARACALLSSGRQHTLPPGPTTPPHMPNRPLSVSLSAGSLPNFITPSLLCPRATCPTLAKHFGTSLKKGSPEEEGHGRRTQEGGGRGRKKGGRAASLPIEAVTPASAQPHAYHATFHTFCTLWHHGWTHAAFWEDRAYRTMGHGETILSYGTTSRILLGPACKAWTSCRTEPIQLLLLPTANYLKTS